MQAVGQAAVGDVDAQLMDAVPRLLREVNASLLLLGKPRAVRALERIAEAVGRRLGPGMALPPQVALDRLADAIVSVEYYKNNRWVIAGALTALSLFILWLYYSINTTLFD